MIPRSSKAPQYVPSGDPMFYTDHNILDPDCANNISTIGIEIAQFSVLLAIEDMTYHDYLERLNGGL